MCVVTIDLLFVASVPQPSATCSSLPSSAAAVLLHPFQDLVHGSLLARAESGLVDSYKYIVSIVS
jgi:hypothetical protein